MAIYLPQDQVVVSMNETTGVETMANAFTYGANIVDHGAPYQGAYISFDGELIQLGGMIRTTASLAVGAVLIKLSPVLAPRANEMTQIEINGVSYPAEIDINGTLITKVAIGVSGTIGLNSVRFLSAEVFVADEDPGFNESAYYPTIQSGKEVIVPTPNEVTSLAVQFDVPFDVVPQVVVNPVTSVPYTTVKGCSVGSITTTGFILYLVRINSTATSVSWIATTENN